MGSKSMARALDPTWRGPAMPRPAFLPATRSRSNARTRRTRSSGDCPMGRPGERDYRYHHRTRVRAGGRTMPTEDGARGYAWAPPAKDPLVSLQMQLDSLRERHRLAIESAASLDAECEKLRASLAAAREDTARLDWIEKNVTIMDTTDDSIVVIGARWSIDAARTREEEKP